MLKKWKEKVTSHSGENYLFSSIKVRISVNSLSLFSFYICKVGQSLSEWVEAITSNNLHPTIWIVETNSQEMHQLYIKLNRICILVPISNIAIDILFKLHWILNINYAIQLENLMLIWCIIFKTKFELKII